jgi:two-component sensor histidine kinase
VSLSREASAKPGSASGNYILTVADDGIGMPSEIHLAATSTMGLQLVSMLVDQLGGQVRLEREGGTAFQITFAAQ